MELWDCGKLCVHWKIRHRSREGRQDDRCSATTLQLGMVLEIHILRAWAVGNRAEPHLVVIFLIEMLCRTPHPIITPGLPILPGRPHISTVIPTALSTMPPIISQ